MLHGRRLDNALEHVNGSRYALVHAVAKRARQITLWLTADPAELRAEAAPPPMASETMSRDPVALAESEILDGEVIVHWDPDGLVDERELPDTTIIETDPLLLEGLDGDDDEDELDVDDEAETLTPALAQAIEGAAARSRSRRSSTTPRSWTSRRWTRRNSTTRSRRRSSVRTRSRRSRSKRSTRATRRRGGRAGELTLETARSGRR